MRQKPVNSTNTVIYCAFSVLFFIIYNNIFAKIYMFFHKMQHEMQHEIEKKQPTEGTNQLFGVKYTSWGYIMYYVL